MTIASQRPVTDLDLKLRHVLDMGIIFAHPNTPLLLGKKISYGYK